MKFLYHCEVLNNILELFFPVSMSGAEEILSAGKEKGIKGMDEHTQRPVCYCDGWLAESSGHAQVLDQIVVHIETGTFASL